MYYLYVPDIMSGTFLNLTTMALERKFLVETLEELLTDEFDSSELVYLTDDQLICKIIESAYYYQRHYNNEVDFN